MCVVNTKPVVPLWDRTGNSIPSYPCSSNGHNPDELQVKVHESNKHTRRPAHELYNKFSASHRLLLAHKQSSHAHPATNTHTRNKYFGSILLRNIHASRNLSRTS